MGRIQGAGLVLVAAIAALAADGCNSDCKNGRCVDTLITQVAFPESVALDPSSLYWTDGGGLTSKSPTTSGRIMKLSLSSGNPSTLLSNVVAQNLVVDSTSLYWTNRSLGTTAGSVMKMALGGGTPTTLAANLDPAGGIALDKMNVYWTSHDGSVQSVPILPGGTPTILASNQTVTSPTEGSVNWTLAVDSVNVYWANANDGSIAEVPIAGGAVVTLASAQSNPWAIAVDATNVYWLNSGTADMAQGTVIKQALAAGSMPVTLATGQQNPNNLTLDATNVYWVDTGTAKNDGAVVSVPIAGGKPVTLESGLPGPDSLAVNGSTLFWADQVSNSLYSLSPK